MLARIILISLFLIGLVLPITLNAMILVLVIRKRKLQQVRFYIIANLAFAEVLVLFILLSVTVKGLYEGTRNEEKVNNISSDIVRSIGFTLYIDSILTITLLAIDRYIAVKYNLHYQRLLTKRRIILVLTISWLLSAVLSAVPWIDVSVYSDLHRNVSIQFIILRFIASLVLLGLSKYTYVIRKQHMERITQRKNSFGVEKEKFDRLKLIKGSLKDSFKFFVTNVILMSAFSLMEIYELVLFEFHNDFKLIVVLLSHCGDIAVVSLSYREIRMQLKRVICKSTIWRIFNRSRVSYAH